MTPLSLTEARALVGLLYDASSRGNIQDALWNLVLEMDACERQRFDAVMMHIWPKPQRNQEYPIDIYNRPIFHNKYGHDAWKETWAICLHEASTCTTLAQALAQAREHSPSWRKHR